MWIIVRTTKGRNSYLTGNGEWTQNGLEAEGFDQFDYAVSHRDRMVPERQRRGVGIVKQATVPRDAGASRSRRDGNVSA
jgi:hypothetical protein